MKKIKFKGTPSFPEYHSHEANFKAGEVKSIPDKVADYLLADFPELFEEVKSGSKKSKSKSMDKPPKDKMIRENNAKKK